MTELNRHGLRESHHSGRKRLPALFLFDAAKNQHRPCLKNSKNFRLYRLSATVGYAVSRILSSANMLQYPG
jgi:hypothetical protein